MRRTSLFALAASLLVLCLAVAGYAAKKIYRARLSANNELHQVDSTAGGTAVLASAINGTNYNFQIFVRNLSGPPTQITLHGPTDENGVTLPIISICGLEPSALGACPALNGDDNLDVSGSLSSSLAQQWNLSGANFRDWLDVGQVYINVTTAAHPDGEVRGQFAQVFP
jgi:hypothetical protein